MRDKLPYLSMTLIKAKTKIISKKYQRMSYLSSDLKFKIEQVPREEGELLEILKIKQEPRVKMQECLSYRSRITIPRVNR